MSKIIDMVRVKKAENGFVVEGSDLKGFTVHRCVIAPDEVTAAAVVVEMLTGDSPIGD